MVNSTEKHRQTVRRTICIGLGGTGKEVLMRIRRLIVDRHQTLEAMPIVSFVHIDTDRGGRGNAGLRSGNVYHGVDLRFKPAETVSATMNRIEVNTFVQGMEKRNEYDRQGPYDHIKRWFPPHLLRDIRGIEEGAKGIRPVGRLAFFHNYRQIKEAIDTAANRTLGHEETMLRKGLIVEPDLNIFVVASVCGGTGSGMFLDVAYHLKRQFGGENVEIFAYLVISPELYGGTPGMNANAYAALKELNYYTTPGTEFTACYDTQELIYVKESRPPFEHVYLISHQTAGSHKIIDKNKLANVIAYKIFLDFSGEVGSMLRSGIDNFHKHMLELDEHPRPNVQGYLTFGLASIYLPKDVSVAISLNRICLKLIDFWSRGMGQNSDVQELVNKFLLRWNKEAVQQNYFTSKLQAKTQDGGRVFIQSLNSWKTNLENEISNCDSKDNRTSVKQGLLPKIKERFRQVIPGDSESTRGSWLTLLRKNRPNLTQELKKDILQFLQELLNPANPDFSLENARGWLEAMITYLNTQQGNIQDYLQTSEAMCSLTDLEAKLWDTDQRLEDIESQSGWFGTREKQKNRQFQEEASFILREGYRLSKHNYELAANQEALGIVKDLQKYLQSLQQKANELHLRLQSVHSSYQTEGEEIVNLNDNEMNGQSVFNREDTDECYETLLPSSDQLSGLKTVSVQIIERVGLGSSLADFLVGDRLVEESDLKKYIYTAVDKNFASRSVNMVQSAAKRFIRSYPSPSERSIRLKQILEEAEVLLPLNLTDPYFYDNPDKRVKFIGFKDSDELEVSQLKSILIDDLGISHEVIRPIQAEDEVLMINVYGAFPLRLINNLEQMRQHYQRYQNQGLGYLHNEYATAFTDLIPPDARTIEAIQDVFYPCLAFEILNYDPTTATYQFSYFDSYYSGDEVLYNLSSEWPMAIEQLSRSRELYEQLKVKLETFIDEKFKKTEENPLEAWRTRHINQYYYPFMRMVRGLPKDDPNYPYREGVIGRKGDIDHPGKEGIMQRFRRRLEAQLQEAYTLSGSDSQTNGLPASSDSINHRQH